MSFKASEFIQNPDGSIYHLNLLPHHISNTIITVGDIDRVSEVTKYFDSVEFKISKREFQTQTGSYKGKRITVISTGIGTDNIDIVLNELDALVNIDFDTKKIKEHLTSLDIFRIGTSGSIQKEVPVDSFLISTKAVGFDSLLHFYKCEKIQDLEFAKSLKEQLNLTSNISPYVVEGNNTLISKFDNQFLKGVTATNCGFYGPQGRILRLALSNVNLNKELESFEFNNQKITNLEMETAGIYGLSKLLNHRAISLNAIIANRVTGEFSKNPGETVDNLIQKSLDTIINI